MATRTDAIALADAVERVFNILGLDIESWLPRMHEFDEEWWQRRSIEAGLDPEPTLGLASRVGAAVGVLADRIKHPDPFDGFS